VALVIDVPVSIPIALGRVLPVLAVRPEGANHQ
jgi:hypothetical protein